MGHGKGQKNNLIQIETFLPIPDISIFVTPIHYPSPWDFWASQNIMTFPIDFG